MNRTLSITLSFLVISPFAACTDESESGEDAAADAAPLGGKSDGSGLRTGRYLSFGSAPGEPLFAAFHEDGQFDVTMVAEDDATEYHQGTYKTYRYGGSDRVRLTDTDGSVLLRADWLYKGADLLQVADVTFYREEAFADNLVDCLAMSIHDRSLGADFNEHNGPSVMVTKVGSTYELVLGSKLFEAPNTKFEVKNSATEVAVVTTTDTGAQFTVSHSKSTPRRGEVMYRKDSSSQPTLMASIVCL